MKFQEMPYNRPDMRETAERVQGLADRVKTAPDGEALGALYGEFCQIRDRVQSQQTITYIRHSINVEDEFYSAENDYFDEQSPVLADKVLAFYRAVLQSPHRGALAAAHGEILLEKFEIAVKQSDERLVPLQQAENALVTEYQKLYASAKIPFQGKELTVAQLAPFKESPDRSIRWAAFGAEGGFFDSKREELDDIYSRLVQNRTEQAGLLGYAGYTPLGDIRMERLGYTREQIRTCRDQVVEGIVPVVQKLKAAQAGRLGLEKLTFTDDLLAFPDGNPTPKGTPEQMLADCRTMYRGLSAETAEFIDFMMDGDLFDVLAKPGKAPGGYCTSIPDYRAPFIFSNFNGTSGDVDVLTHEAGHAFADYVASRRDLPLELRTPGMESCEIHSMSMEFLTAGYHERFFKADTDKYAFAHLEDALYFLPYGCMVDEFQENVYENPGLTPDERNAMWLELEAKYRPWVDFDGLPFYSRGAGWQRQLHIYHYPFYYIDYVLAQAVALEFFLARERDPDDAWRRYLALVQKGGTETYTGLVHAAGFQTPFQPGMLERVGNQAYAWLEGHRMFR